MSPLFWLIAASLVLMVTLIALRRLLGFGIDLRIGQKPAYAPAARAVIWLAVVCPFSHFVLSGETRLGLLAGVLIWEIVAWARRRSPAENPIAGPTTG
jgi:hypothetical protein